MNTMRIMIIACIAVLFSSTGCKKYDDGPGFSLRSKTGRLARTWVIDKVTLDNVIMMDDEIALDEGGTNVTNTFTKDGKFSFSLIDSNGVLHTGTGKWTFANDKNAITISDETGLESETSTILRLTSSELWYWHMDGTERMEMHWKAK